MMYDGGPPWEEGYADCYKDIHVLKKIAVCLDKMLDEKYRCGLPGISKEVVRLEHKLNYLLDRRSKYGLYKIKHEIVDCAKRMKDFIDKSDKIEDVVKHSAMVINEIKKEVRNIEGIVTDPKFDDIIKHSALILNEIKKDIKKIERIVVDPKFEDIVKHSTLLLKDIKTEIKKIEEIVVDPKFEEIVKHSSILLKDIRTEIKKIEEIVVDPKFEDIVKHSSMLMRDIKKEIAKLEEIICDPEYGLKEIKRAIDNKPANTLTTGPIFVDYKGIIVTNVHLKALNYSDEARTVTFTIHTLTNDNPLTTGEQVVTLEVPPLSSKSTDVPLTEYVQNLEVRAAFSDPTNVFVYAAIQDISDPSGPLVKRDVLHSQWSPIIVKNCNQ